MNSAIGARQDERHGGPRMAHATVQRGRRPPAQQGLPRISGRSISSMTAAWESSIIVSTVASMATWCFQYSSWLCRSSGTAAVSGVTVIVSMMTRVDFELAVRSLDVGFQHIPRHMNHPQPHTTCSLRARLYSQSNTRAMGTCESIAAKTNRKPHAHTHTRTHAPRLQRQ